MREIALTNGGVALVDDEDFERVSGRKWYSHKENGITYAVEVVTWGNRRLRMHRLVTSAPDGVGVDHVNGDGLDNRRGNLRTASGSQNQANRKRLTLNTSGFRGVTLHKGTGRWQAGIKLQGRSVYLGLYSEPSEAARAYDTKARELFGEFANPNFVEAA